MATQGMFFSWCKAEIQGNKSLKGHIKPLLASICKHSTGQNKTHGQAQYQLAEWENVLYNRNCKVIWQKTWVFISLTLTAKEFGVTIQMKNIKDK